MKDYSTVADHDQLPNLDISEKELGKVTVQTFGSDQEPKAVSAGVFLDSEWSRKYEQFYRQRIVYVRSNNVLLLRFAYSYEIDLDRIKTEADLLW
jgi:hypothetical protein